MAREFRRITFTLEEFQAASIPYFEAVEHRALPGGPRRVRSLRKDNDIYIELEHADGSAGRVKTSMIPEDEAQRRIIEFCAARNIPLPNEAEKTLRIIDTAVCLEIFFKTLSV